MLDIHQRDFNTSRNFFESFTAQVRNEIKDNNDRSWEYRNELQNQIRENKKFTEEKIVLLIRQYQEALKNSNDSHGLEHQVMKDNLESGIKIIADASTDHKNQIEKYKNSTDKVISDLVIQLKAEMKNNK